MAIQTGDFSPSQLAVAITTADKMWKDNMINADFEANNDIYKAIRKEQNAEVSMLQSSDKDKDVKVTWINTTNDTVSDLSNDHCTPGGDQLATDSKTYGISQAKVYKFSVDEYKMRTNDYNMEQIVAKGFLRADKALSEAVSSYGHAKIEAFKGVNVVADGMGTHNVVSGDTDIDAADFDHKLFAYLYRIGIQNQLSNPFLISGSNLFEDRLIAMQSQANGEGKGAANLFKMIRTYFDLFNIDSANAGDFKTYLINRGAMAFASKSREPAVPKKYMTQTRYSIPSRNMPGVRFDVHYDNKCSADTMLHNYDVIARFDYFQNPLGLNDTRTGIIAINKLNA